MIKVITATILGAALMAGNALASPIYYEATNVSGTAQVDYGILSGGTLGINDAPIFSFTGTSGTVSENLALYTPGDYTVSFLLEGLTIDINEDGADDFNLAPFSFTSGPVTLPALSLAGTAGQLSWDFDPYSGGWLSYDFGNTGSYTNMNVNQALAYADIIGSGSHVANGVMDANIGWDKLRVELNAVNAVPEPATLLLFGVGLLGVVGFKRRQLRA